MMFIAKSLHPVGIVLMLVVAAACNEKKSEPPAGASARGGNMPLQAEGFVVRTRPLNESIEMPGTILPFETTEIRPEISGRIIELNIPEGRVVRKGTLLAKLFDGDLQAQLKKLEVQLSIAQKTVERQKALLDISGISQQEYDLSQLEANNLSADIEMVKVSIGKTRIVAPYTGKIGLKNISLGAYVSPTNILTTISQVDNLKLEFTVPEKYSENMRKGRKVFFTIGGLDKKYSASIMATESTIEANTRSLRVRAIINGQPDDLVPGGFAKVSLQLSHAEEPMVVPTQAVIPRARDKQVIIFRGGKPEFKVVSTGIRDSSYVQVLEGLNVGDTVVTTALLAIRPDSKVSLTKVN
jgi:membrane fusion protein (multidrug efflux system)